MAERRGIGGQATGFCAARGDFTDPAVAAAQRRVLPGTAQNLLKQTFSGSHTVKSGVLSLTSDADRGRAPRCGPISLSLNGPFQSRGNGQASRVGLHDRSRSTATASHGQLGLISTGTTGYVTLDGHRVYQPPRRTSTSSPRASRAPARAGGRRAGKLGIHPLHWLTNPPVVGHRERRRRRDHPHPGERQRRRRCSMTSTPSCTRRPGDRRQLDDPEHAVGRDPAEDRRRGQEPDGRHLDRHQRQDLRQADDRPGRSRSAARRRRARRDEHGRDRADASATPTSTSRRRSRRRSNVRPFCQASGSKLRSVLAQAEGIAFLVAPARRAHRARRASSGSGGLIGLDEAGVNKYSKCIQQAGSDVSKMQEVRVAASTAAAAESARRPRRGARAQPVLAGAPRGRARFRPRPRRRPRSPSASTAAVVVDLEAPRATRRARAPRSAPRLEDQHARSVPSNFSLLKISTSRWGESSTTSKHLPRSGG